MAQRYRTAQVAAESGYSVQQVRDLERLGVIPPAVRAANGYREFTGEHLLALRAYRALATAVGPVVARESLREVRVSPLADAAARVSELHVGLAKERHDALAALSALRAIQAEAPLEVGEEDSMSITQLAGALGVRSSTLQFWEQEGLVVPERVTSQAARRYPPAAIREARITAVLRAAGYRIPEVRRAIEAVREHAGLDDLADALHDRLTAIAQRTLSLLTAGTAFTHLITPNAPQGHLCCVERSEGGLGGSGGALLQ
ncbi:MerR family transcriptional regulator [Prauserella flavalba]|uniref:MerR family transcriptional regulator n=1 Tax=Prauserella flavalba TaxID=1477506 RepID=A0A318LUY6_9PSEU|nr:MerR family transcriptional regulator [Prauserella flavalba]PXY37315.1 MerR family transcriptional regulator [Prauserella flavalba]